MTKAKKQNKKTKVEDQESTLHQIVEKAYEIRSKHLDFFFIAFLEETGIKPSQAELVEKTVEGNKGKEVRWSFRKRK